MFCIFPAISLPRAFTFEATEKELRHFSFSDVFRAFRNLGAFTNVCNLLLCYHNDRILICRYQGVMLTNNVKLFWEILVNLSVIIKARLWLLA